MNDATFHVKRTEGGSPMRHRRSYVRGGSALCSRCHLNPRRANDQRYCGSCHNANMRAKRPRHSELTPEQRLRANARRTANYYQSRGVLVPQPCQNCGAEKAQKHHPDYSKPLQVVWLCRPCHLSHHQELEAQVAA